MQDLLSWIHTLSIHLSNDQRQNNPTSTDLYCQRTASCRTVLSESSTKGIIKVALEWKKCWGASGYIASTSHDFGWFQEMLANMRLFSTKEAGKHEETWSLIHKKNCQMTMQMVWVELLQLYRSYSWESSATVDLQVFGPGGAPKRASANARPPSWQIDLQQHSWRGWERSWVPN